MPTVLITGGAKRIGAEMARRFAREGFDVVVHHNTSVAEAESLARELNETRHSCWLVQGDLSSQTAVASIFEQARAAVGPIDLCINNASQFINDDETTASAETLAGHMNINLLAPVFLSRLMKDQTEAAGDRLIINMLDNKVYAMNPDFFTYTLSKTALLTATEMLAMRFDGFPRVCGIAPSITLISGDQTPDAYERSSRINPLERKVLPSDLSHAALFIWNAKSYDKQVICVDAGQSMLKLPRDVAFLTPEGKLDA